MPPRAGTPDTQVRSPRRRAVNAATAPQSSDGLSARHECRQLTVNTVATCRGDPDRLRFCLSGTQQNQHGGRAARGRRQEKIGDPTPVDHLRRVGEFNYECGLYRVGVGPKCAITLRHAAQLPPRVIRRPDGSGDGGGASLFSLGRRFRARLAGLPRGRGAGSALCLSRREPSAAHECRCDAAICAQSQPVVVTTAALSTLY